MIENYIEYFNNTQSQRNLGVLTSMENMNTICRQHKNCHQSLKSGGINIFDCLLDGQQSKSQLQRFFIKLSNTQTLHILAATQFP